MPTSSEQLKASTPEPRSDVCRARRVRVSHRIGRFLLHAFAGVFALAGVSKLLDFSSFVDTLHGWKLIPPTLRAATAVLLPSIEIALSLCWYLKLAPIRSMLGLGALLAALTAAYTAHAIWAETPPRRCFGMLLVFEQTRSGWLTAVYRNLLLLTCWALGLALLRSGTTTRDQTLCSDRGKPPPVPAG